LGKKASLLHPKTVANDINENRPSTPVLSEVEAHSSHKKRGIRLLGMTSVIYLKSKAASLNRPRNDFLKGFSPTY
jgi:hypothetical protein